MRKTGITRWIRVCLLLACAGMLLSGCGKKYLKEGTEYLEEGSYEEALDSFQTAVEKKQSVGEAYRGIGIANWELGDYEAARDAFEAAIENDAKRTAALYNFLGCCELKLSNPKASINYFNLGLEAKDAGDDLIREMRFNMIAAYEQCEDMETARTLLSDYLEDFPDDERALKEAEFLETQ